MLKSLLTNFRWEPAAVEPTGAPATPAVAPINTTPIQEGTMPESMKGVELSLDDTGEPPTPEETPDGKIVDKKVTPPVAPVVPPAKVEEPKKPAGLELPKLTKAADVKAEVVPPKTGEVPKGGRDYTKFSAEDAPRLKKMNNEDFAYWEKRLPTLVAAEKKATELEAKIKTIEADPNAVPRDWYNHPEAYALHPSYQRGYQTFQRAQFEHEHAKQQMEKIEANEDWQMLMGYNKQTGQPVFETRKADPASKVAMMGQMNAAAQTVNNIQGQLAQFEGTFKQRYESSVGMVNKIVEEKFPWVKDPNDVHHKDAQQLMEATPEEFRSHPSAKVASYLWATLIEFARTNDELVAQLKTGKTLKQIQEEVEPNPTTVATTTVEPAQVVGGKGKPLTGLLDLEELSRD